MVSVCEALLDPRSCSRSQARSAQRLRDRRAEGEHVAVARAYVKAAGADAGGAVVRRASDRRAPDQDGLAVHGHRVVGA